MPIRIVETRSAGSPTESHIFIGSTALRLLEAELQAYCEGTFKGRSFLIAGHRGAGKTTLVDAAIQRVANTFLSQRARQTAGSSDANFVLRPLLVPLQGPSLLPPEGADTSAKATASAAANSATAKAEIDPAAAAAAQIAAALKEGAPDSAPGEPTLGPTETVLVQIILGLYRALANEFVEAYTVSTYRRIDPDLFTEGPSRRAPRPSTLAELELAAQFELDLDEYPGKARLRDYWRRIGALESGILFPGFTNRPVGNGYRELVALASACEAYQRICGHFTRKQESSSDDARESRAALELEAKGNVLLRPLAVLLTGGAVGAGVSATGAGSAWSAFAGAIAALASAAGVHYTSSRSRRQASNRSELFIPDLSVATLDRVLPVLIQRILRAGLAPIFLVDELDKVDLSDRITDMVKRLKKLVAEQAFFCFLTDRKYFEELSDRTANAPYPIEYTYYSHQLFIVYSHQDLHRYLKEILRPETLTAPGDPSAAATPPATAASPSAPAAAPSSTGSTAGSPPTSAQPAPPVADDDTIDAQILPYLILHASQMHTIDVRRQLLALRDENGVVSYSPGQIRGHDRFRYALLIQLAIETALESPDVTPELELRPAFLQIVRDALYFASRRWAKCPDNLDLSDGEGRHGFETYLRQRMETGANLTGTSQTGASQTSTNAPAPPDLPSADFLLEQARALALALTNVEAVRKAAEYRGIAQVVLDNLPKNPLLYETKKHKYRWHCHPSGRKVEEVAPNLTANLRAVAAPAKPSPGMWDNEVGIVEEFQLGLNDLVSGVTPAILSNQLGILPTTPSWAATEDACKRLRASEPTGAEYPDIHADIACVHEYVVNLRANAKVFSQALVLSGVLSAKDFFPDDLAPLAILTDLLRLRTMTAEAGKAKIKHLFDLLPDTGLTDDDDSETPETILPERAIVSTWLQHIAGLAKDPARKFSPSDKGANDLVEEAWKYWRSRLSASTIGVRDPGLAVFYCALQFKGPGRYLSTDPDNLTISGWSYIFLAGLDKNTPNPNEAPRPWLTLVAATRLGFGEAVRHSKGLMTRVNPGNEDLSYMHFGDTSSTAAIVLSLSSARAFAWMPQPAFPILYVQTYSASSWIAMTSELKQLNFSILALDGENTAASEAAPQTKMPWTSPLEDLPHLTAPLNSLGFTLLDPIPVIVANPATRRNWPPNFHAISAENPEELFRVTQSLRENSQPRQA